MYGTVKAEMVCTQVRSSCYVFLSYGDHVKNIHADDGFEIL